MKKTHSQPSALGDRAADQKAGGGAYPADSAPDAQRLVALRPLLEDGRQERQSGRRQDRRGDPLEHARGNQDLIGPSEPAEERRRREQRDADHEHPSAPEQVG